MGEKNNPPKDWNKEQLSQKYKADLKADQGQQG